MNNTKYRKFLSDKQGVMAPSMADRALVSLPELFGFMWERRDDLIRSISAHRRPPIEGVIKNFYAAYDSKLKYSYVHRVPLCQLAGMVVSWIVEDAGYLPVKRSGIRKSLNAKGYMKSTMFYAEAERVRNMPVHR